MTITEKIKSHKLWLDTNKQEGQMANLRWADLRWANTYGIASIAWRGPKHYMVVIGKWISIGCITNTAKWWIKNAARATEREKYTDIEKNLYLKKIKEVQNV